MHKRVVAILLASLPPLVCGACGTSSDGNPAPGGMEGGVLLPDASSGGEGGGSSTPDAAQGIDTYAAPLAADASGGGTHADGSVRETGADGSGSEAGLDATAAKDGTGEGAPDGSADAGLGDAGVAQPFKGVAGSGCAELLQLNVSWWYDWEQTPTGCTSPPFVPMVWGHANEQTAAGITSEVSAGVSAGYKYVLGFNEPDNASQSNISVATAISLWPAFNNPAVLVGSPATQGNATGLTWIQDFMSQVNADTTGKLRVDFIATHWYGWDTGACDPAANTLESWIAGIEAIPGNRPIWLTEWGCDNQSNPNAATVEAFYAGALAMFAKHPRVVRYAWYQWETYNELVDADSGALTPLGMAYVAAPPFH